MSKQSFLSCALFLAVSECSLNVMIIQGVSLYRTASGRNGTLFHYVTISTRLGYITISEEKVEKV